MIDKGKELLDLLGGVLILFPLFFQILFSFFRVEIVRRLINQLYTQIKQCCGEGYFDLWLTKLTTKTS